LSVWLDERIVAFVANSDTSTDASGLEKWWWSIVAVPLVGVACIVVYAFSVGSGSVGAVAVAIATGAWIAGGLLGFLFGVPRVLKEGGPTGTLGSNTNLEQISDWLTKILVGLGLVEIRTLVKSTEQFINFLGPSLGGKDSSPAFALALLVIFGSSGFLALYLVTRVWVVLLFAKIEAGLRDILQRREQLLGESTQERQDG
jgi:hypothetical protein